MVRGCEQVEAGIALEKRGRVVTVRLDEGAIGSYELVVSELLGTKGEKLVDHYRLPFSVVPIAGRSRATCGSSTPCGWSSIDLNVTRVAPGEGRGPDTWMS